jgi:hypothetical protein
MNRNILMVVVVIVVAAIIGTAYMILGQSDDGGENETYRTGDYVEWTWSLAAEGNNSVKSIYSIQRHTIVEIENDVMTINQTFMNQTRIVQYYNETSLPSNSTAFGSYTTLGLGIPSGYNVTAIGTEVLPTKWGNVTVDHYQWTYLGGEDLVTIDVWVKGNIFMKMVQNGTDYDMIIELTDSNLVLVEEV